MSRNNICHKNNLCPAGRSVTPWKGSNQHVTGVYISLCKGMWTVEHCVYLMSRDTICHAITYIMAVNNEQAMNNKDALNNKQAVCHEQAAWHKETVCPVMLEQTSSMLEQTSSTQQTGLKKNLKKISPWETKRLLSQFWLGLGRKYFEFFLLNLICNKSVITKIPKYHSRMT